MGESGPKRQAVVLFNLGGPDSLEAVRPFLFNLFRDPAIIRAPQPFRLLIAKLISWRRARQAKEIYRAIGANASPARVYAPRKKTSRVAASASGDPSSSAAPHPPEASGAPESPTPSPEPAEEPVKKHEEPTSARRRPRRRKSRSADSRSAPAARSNSGSSESAGTRIRPHDWHRTSP